jgi:hypothetical protein
MDVAIRIGRAIMEHEQRPSLGLLTLALIQPHFLPAREPFGLGFRQARFHRKLGGGKKERGAVIALARIGRVGLGHGGTRLEDETKRRNVPEGSDLRAANSQRLVNPHDHESPSSLGKTQAF